MAAQLGLGLGPLDWGNRWTHEGGRGGGLLQSVHTACNYIGHGLGYVLRILRATPYLAPPFLSPSAAMYPIMGALRYSFAEPWKVSRPVWAGWWVGWKGWQQDTS